MQFLQLSPVLSLVFYIFCTVSKYSQKKINKKIFFTVCVQHNHFLTVSFYIIFTKIPFIDFIYYIFTMFSVVNRMHARMQYTTMFACNDSCANRRKQSLHNCTIIVYNGIYMTRHSRYGYRICKQLY